MISIHVNNIPLSFSSCSIFFLLLVFVLLGLAPPLSYLFLFYTARRYVIWDWPLLPLGHHRTSLWESDALSRSWPPWGQHDDDFLSITLWPLRDVIVAASRPNRSQKRQAPRLVVHVKSKVTSELYLLLFPAFLWTVYFHFLICMPIFGVLLSFSLYLPDLLKNCSLQSLPSTIMQCTTSHFTFTWWAGNSITRRLHW